MESELVRRLEREFFVVYKAVDKLRRSAPVATMTQLELEWTCSTLLWLMREADCIDPTALADFTSSARQADQSWPQSL